MALNKENYNYSDPKEVPNLTVDGNLVVGGSSTAGSTSSGSSSSTSVGGGAVAQTTEPTNPTAGLVWVNTAGNAIGSQIFRWRKASAGGSSVLTGFDDNSLLLQYTPGYEHVYVNGILLVRNLDYVATTGTTISLNQALVTGDVVEIFNVIINGVTNTYTQAQADGKYVALGGGSLITPSNATVTGLKITGAASQTADYLSITNALGTNMMKSDSSGNLTIAGTYSGGSASLSGSLSLPNNNNSSTGRLYLAGGDTNHYIYSTGSGGNTLVFGEYGNFSWYNTATNSSYMNLDSGGNLQLGSGYSTANSLRYFDIYNQDTNGASGSIIRLITQQSSSTSLTTVDMVKYKNGNFIINNNDSAAAILFGTAGTNRLTINNVGNVGLGLASQTNPYPANQSTMEINVTQGGQNALWLKNYSGSTASPTEVTDWPKGVLAATSYGNFFLQTMLTFGLPGDGIYKTDNSIWNFRLNGVTGGGWDNFTGINTTTPINTSTGAASGPVGLQLLGPGNLRLGTDGAYNIFFHTNAVQQAAINSNGYLLVGYSTSNGAYRLQVNSQIFATSASIATSDAKYKKNVSPLTGGLDMIKALNPVEFEWKDQEDLVINDKVVREKHNFAEGKTVGFIAQEVQEALKDKDWVDNLVKNNVREAVKDGAGNVIAEEEDFLGIAETNLIAVLVAAVKELTAKVESLEAKVNDKS